MKLIVFLMLVVALTGLNIASHDWRAPKGACRALLNENVQNQSGRLVIKSGG
jgi:hypothetical protein